MSCHLFLSLDGFGSNRRPVEGFRAVLHTAPHWHTFLVSLRVMGPAMHFSPACPLQREQTHAPGHGRVLMYVAAGNLCWLLVVEGQKIHPLQAKPECRTGPFSGESYSRLPQPTHVASPLSHSAQKTFAKHVRSVPLPRSL